MKIYSSISEYKGKPPVVTMGTFDGVHPGHKALLKEIVDIAKKENSESMAITFWPHPRLVLEKDADRLRLLNTLDEKIKLIEEIGVEHLMVIPFSKELSELSSKEFTENILVKQLNISHLVTGFNHQFGNDGITTEELKFLSDKHCFKFNKFHHIDVGGDHPSSTQIRKLLLSGKIERANHLLGYNYTITGKVTQGKKLGRTISYPTANVDITESCKLIPLDGVYACSAKVDGKTYNAMVNIGVRPTVSTQLDHRTVEVHILDFNQDIYGKELSVYFIERVRNEMKFDGIDALKAQLNRDEIIIRQILDK